MEGRNVVLDRISELARAREVRAPVEGRPPGEYLTVKFDGGQTGLLDMASARSTVWADVLRSLQQAGRPAYVVIDPETGFITEVLQPIRFSVGRIEETADGEALEIELIISHAVHILRRSNPDFERLRSTLEKARSERAEVLVTETLTEHEILDVRRVEGNAQLAG
jgi:hypothetical protein